MILYVNQVMQDLFAADFQIIRSNRPVGNMSFRGRLGSKDGHWYNNLLGHRFEMGFDVTKREGLPKKAYHPYQVYLNNALAGYLFTDTVKESFFSSYNVARLQIGTGEYVMYYHARGEEGVKNPIFCNGSQVAQIEKDCVTYNELHQYRILAVDEYAATAALMYCSYMYVRGSYKPGVKVTQSFKKTVTTTTNKTVKSMYDPTFARRVTE